MKIFLIISLLSLNISLAQYDQYGSQGYNQQDQQGNQQQQKGGSGLERKNLLDTMSIGDKTSLTEDEKCKSKCNMTFVQCYRIQTDRSKCYSTQQECLNKCGGEETQPDFNAQDQGGGGQIGF